MTSTYGRQCLEGNIRLLSISQCGSFEAIKRLDKVRLPRTCSRPVGTGMMLPAWLMHSFHTRFGLQPGAICSLVGWKSACIHYFDTGKFEFSGIWPQFNEVGLELDNHQSTLVCCIDDMIITNAADEEAPEDK